MEERIIGKVQLQRSTTMCMHGSELLCEQIEVSRRTVQLMCCGWFFVQALDRAASHCELGSTSLSKLDTIACGNSVQEWQEQRRQFSTKDGHAIQSERNLSPSLPLLACGAYSVVGQANFQMDGSVESNTFLVFCIQLAIASYV